jgi:hypothetical protein
MFDIVSVLKRQHYLTHMPACFHQFMRFGCLCSRDIYSPDFASLVTLSLAAPKEGFFCIYFPALFPPQAKRGRSSVASTG